MGKQWTDDVLSLIVAFTVCHKHKRSEGLKHQSQCKARKNLQKCSFEFENELRNREKEFKSQERELAQKEAKLESKLESTKEKSEKLDRAQSDVEAAKKRVEKEVNFA